MGEYLKRGDERKLVILLLVLESFNDRNLAELLLPGDELYV